LGNLRLKDKITDLRELMKVVDDGYDSNAREVMSRNKELESEVKALELALKVAEKHGSHMEDVSSFFNDK
jgi:hypothetical protein